MDPTIHDYGTGIPAWAPTPVPLIPSNGISQFCNSRPLRRSTVRNRKPRFAISMTAQGPGAGSADEYAQFKDMLNTETSAGATSPSDAQGAGPVESQVANAEQDQYAEFSELLGVENVQPKADYGRKSVAEAKPRKVEIDPADYDVFDTLLERTGGTGRKPMKGSKRYMSRPVSSSQRATVESNTRQTRQDEVGSFIGNDSENSEKRQRSPQLSEDEKAEAYAIMVEEFGAGIHKGMPTKPAEAEVTQVEPTKPTLMEPPKLPAEYRGQAVTSNPLTTSLRSENSVERDPGVPQEPPVLKPKPTSPTRIVPSAQAAKKVLQSPVAFFEENEDVPSAEVWDEPVPELKPKPAIPASPMRSPATVPGVAMSTSTLPDVSSPTSPASPVETEQAPRVPPLREPPTRSQRIALAEALNTQIRGPTVGPPRRGKEVRNDVQILQNPKLVCDLE